MRSSKSWNEPEKPIQNHVHSEYPAGPQPRSAWPHVSNDFGSDAEDHGAAVFWRGAGSYLGLLPCAFHDSISLREAWLPLPARRSPGERVANADPEILR